MYDQSDKFLELPDTTRDALLGAPLPDGPTGRHWGMHVVRVLADSVVVARVLHTSPRGGDGYVRLSDGTVRSTSLGQWYLLRGES